MRKHHKIGLKGASAPFKMRDYFIVEYQILRPFHREGDNMRWAYGDAYILGDFRQSYILGAYTTNTEAQTVRRLLRGTYPAKHRYVQVRVCKGNSHTIREKLRAELGGARHQRYRLNRFYPEAMCNGYSDALPPVPTEILKVVPFILWAPRGSPIHSLHIP